jgi:hypothetical protein
LKPLWVVVHGEEEHHPEARYKVSWYDNGKRRFEDVGQDTDVAVAAISRARNLWSRKLRDSRSWTRRARVASC